MNYMIYAKPHDEKRYGAMDVRRGRVGVGRVFATLYPQLERAKYVADTLATQYPQDSFQVRTAAKGRAVYTGVPNSNAV